MRKLPCKLGLSLSITKMLQRANPKMLVGASCRGPFLTPWRVEFYRQLLPELLLAPEVPAKPVPWACRVIIAICGVSAPFTGSTPSL